MNPFAAIARYFRLRKMIEIECKVAGLTAKLKRTEELASRVANTVYDVRAIEISKELWENKHHLQILAEHDNSPAKR